MNNVTRNLIGLAAAFFAGAVAAVFLTLTKTAHMAQGADRLAAGLIGFVWVIALVVTGGALLAMAMGTVRAKVAADGRRRLYDALEEFARSVNGRPAPGPDDEALLG